MRSALFYYRSRCKTYYCDSAYSSVLDMDVIIQASGGLAPPEKIPRVVVSRFILMVIVVRKFGHLCHLSLPRKFVSS